MDPALKIVAIMALVLAVTTVARAFAFLAPLLLLLVGVGCSYIPGIPSFELTPDLVLIGLLPPLLYSAALQTSLVDLYRERGPVARLSILLVIFTAFGVGLIAWQVLPIGFAVAFALGAVVAPPDAVAATAIARRVGMPRRVVTMLEGESLLNDATALVLLTTAIAAIGETVTVGDVALTIVEAVVGGVLVGFLVAKLVAKLRVRLTHDLTDVGLSLLTPWLAYLPAEEIHGSGVLAVVIAGLLLGHRSPVIQSASSRLFDRTNWATIAFLLENAVFLLIGLQARTIVEDLASSSVPTAQIVGAAAAVLAAVILLRFVYAFLAGAFGYLVRGRRVGHPEIDDSLGSYAKIFTLLSWSGMRGVVTLASVFLLPQDTPHREVLVLIAFVVTAGTLLLQGLTLPWMVRKLRVRGPSALDDALQQATIYQRAADAGSRRLAELAESESDDVIELVRARSEQRTHGLWEQLGGADDPPSVRYAHTRTAVLQAEREELIRLRDSGEFDQQALRVVLATLDMEETVLGAMAARADRVQGDLRLQTVEGACEHLRAAPDTPPARTPDGCEECLRDGTDWVHLRICLTCGHVGCCDSSVGRHADAHFRETGHPVMQSFERGEHWRWCYLDDVAG